MDFVIATTDHLMPLAKFGYWGLGIVFFVLAIWIEIKVLKSWGG